MTLRERLAGLKRRGYQEERQREEARYAWAAGFDASSEIAQQAYVAIKKQGANEKYAGWVAAWVEAWLLRHKEWKRSRVMEQTLERDLHLRNMVCGMPVLDVSRPGFLPGVLIAMLRPDMTLVLPIEDSEEADWLEATLETLKVDNVIVARNGIGDVKFEEMICRDERGVHEILRRSKRWQNLGGRWYLARYKDEGMEPDGLLVQTIPMGPKCFVMHFVGVPHEPGVGQLLKTAALLLDKIEAEMKRNGMWSENPPPLLEMFNRGELRSFEDVPVFDHWLQAVFLVRAREAVELDEFPEHSQVSDMLRRQYDPHLDMPVAGRLVDYLRAFDLLVEQRHQPGLKLTGIQAVSEGGRLLTKGKWREPEWYSVDATPYDPDYFPKAMAMLAWGLGMEVQGGDPWEFVLDGARIAVKMHHRASCSIAAETMAVRDKIFDGLVRAGC
jgi:uncharacterized protein YqcC (DUF446 family)